MNKETNYIDAVTKLKDFINEQDVFIEKLIATNNELINVLEICAKVVDQYEVVQMCLNAISKSRGNV